MIDAIIGWINPTGRFRVTPHITEELRNCYKLQYRSWFRWKDYKNLKGMPVFFRYNDAVEACDHMNGVRATHGTTTGKLRAVK